MALSKARITIPIAYAIAFGMTFVIGSILILFFTGKNPLAAFKVFLTQSYFSTYGVLEILSRATPIILAGAGMVIAFQCGTWNLGAEGQMAIGAIISTALGLYVDLPGIVLLPLIFCSSFAGGALWSGIAGHLKNRLGVHEMLSTLMLNYIALKLMEYMVRGPLMLPNAIYPKSPEILPQAQMPFIKYQLNTTLVIALLILPVVWFLITRTTLGYRLQAVGLNREAARVSGIDVRRITLTVMLLSGGISAMGGTVEIVGDFMRMEMHVTGGYGFIAIFVVMLARQNIVALPFAAFLISGMMVGATALTLAEVPAAFYQVVIGLLLLCIVFASYIEEKLRLRWET